MTEQRDLETIATQVMQEALKKGADVAEVSLGRSWDLSVKVRLGNVELLEEAGSSGLALRVIRGDRVSATSTTDLTEAGLLRCVEDALMLAELSEADPFAAPADPSEFSHGPIPSSTYSTRAFHQSPDSMPFNVHEKPKRLPSAWTHA